MMRRDRATRASPLERRLRRLTAGERRDEAAAFIRRYHRENAIGEASCRARLAEVGRSLRCTGTYAHSPEELAFGARLAWRNHARCIGRLYWESLEVIDARHVVDPDEMAGAIMDHMAAALGEGRIRSMITIFAPIEPGRYPAYVESPQITRYAGYLVEDGTRIGDRQNIEATRAAIGRGWIPPEPRGAFDLLPMVIREPKGGRLLYEIPRDVVREIPIAHPKIPAIAELGLRWYAVPCVSDMILTIGGVDYPCAPFNGFYMCTEIASRNFADENRYDLLPQVARALGDDPEAPGPEFWRDRALTELNQAVLSSFEAAGVTMTDHHSESRRYMTFAQRERAQGREPSGVWPWIVPPQASAACPVFHVDMRDVNATPNFYRSRAIDGARLAPNYDDEDRSRLFRRIDREKRRWRRRWRRWVEAETVFGSGFWK